MVKNYIKKPSQKQNIFGEVKSLCSIKFVFIIIPRDRWDYNGREGEFDIRKSFKVFGC